MINRKPRKVLIFDLDDTLFDSTNQPKETVDEWPLTLFEGWLPILSSGDFQHILVTKVKKGEEARQNRKIDVLRIREYFAAIHLVERDEHKFESFKMIAESNKDTEIVVIGNRIDSEIRYGNMLGLKTLHILHGKYRDLKPKDNLEVPHHSFEVSALSLIKSVL